MFKARDFSRIKEKLTPAKDVFDRFHMPRMLLVAGLALIIAVILSPNLVSRVPRYEIGDYAIGNLRAPFDLVVEDREATGEAKVKAIASSPMIFDYDPNSLPRAIDRINSAFSSMAKLYEPLDQIRNNKKNKISKKEEEKRIEKAEFEVKSALEKAKPDFYATLGVDLTDPEFEYLADKRFSPRFAGNVTSLLEMVYGRYVTFDYDEIMQILAEKDEKAKKPIRLRIRGKEEEKKIKDSDQVTSPKLAAESLNELAANVLASETIVARNLVVKIVKQQIKPNMVYDSGATETSRKSAVETVLPVTYTFKKNQLIIGDGQKVERQVKVVLDYLRERSAPAGWVKTMVGLALLVFGTLLLSFWLVDVNIKQFVLTDRDVMVLGILLVVTLGALRFFDWFSDRLLDQFPGMPTYFMLFLFPIAAPTMLVRFLIRFEVALLFAVVLTVFSSLTIQAPIHFMAVMFVVAVVGAHTMNHVSRRGQVVRGGLWVGVASIGGAFLIALLTNRFTVGTLVYTPLAGLASGLLSGVLVVGLAPAFEYTFGYMTDISLLELANYEQPLLKRISHLAPGTFHHSISISTFAESAAEAIGANTLLVRVGALYHDLGKSLNPDYFVENQIEKNPHDQIKMPEESARIIKAHVIDGARFAREQNLPQAIIDFIEQHHGTRKIAYFYDKALKLAEQTGENVDANLYTYPGPKPQTRETAILMICDVLEARSRTIKDRHEEVVRAMVDEMIKMLEKENQFDECPLTIGDLKKIGEAITLEIIGMTHHRIKYPDQKK